MSNASGEAPVLKGLEVKLRPLVASDAEALALAAAESREQYRFNPVPMGKAEAVEYVNRALQQCVAGERLPFVIEWKGCVVGTTSYSEIAPWTWPTGSESRARKHPDVTEIGYTWLVGSAQRTRCNTEAKFLLLDHAFSHWLVYRVAFRTDERNNVSRAAIERLGARFEGIRRADIPGMDGSIRNSAFYSIVDSEWSQVRRRLVRRMG
jgi:RimJ/RimL family protein N-acetyltransferase